MPTKDFKDGQRNCQALIRERGLDYAKAFYDSKNHARYTYETYPYADEVWDYWEGYKKILENNNSTV